MQVDMKVGGSAVTLMGWVNTLFCWIDDLREGMEGWHETWDG